jgi:D-alanyl-D-alanine carboxypeptidase-like protein
MKRLVLAGVLTAFLAAACNHGGAAANEPFAGATTPASVVAIQSEASPTPTASPSATPSGPPPTPSSTPTSPKAQSKGWHATVAVIDAATRVRMKYSWRRGCPVPLRNLRLLTMTYWGFDRSVHTGEMVVHERVVAGVLKAFRAMFQARYPIRRMRLVDEYRGDDDRSMAADNTSAFNCRRVTGGSAWSQHSYGWAIDINPIENPYVSRDKVLPPAGRKYADRSRRARGMIHRGDVVWRAFRSIGWGWGGDWRSFQDYQHFSATGR